MKQVFIDWSSGRIETQYRGARTVRYVNHMQPKSLARLQSELNQLALKGYYPTKWGSGYLYSKGAA